MNRPRVNRLWLKIFAAFWVVMIATVVITVSLSGLIFRDEQDSRRFDITREAFEKVGAQAQTALDRGGEPGLRAWLDDWHVAQPFPPLLILGPDGRDLLGRPLPPRMRDRLAREVRGNAPRRFGRDRGRARTLEARDGQIYRVMLPRFRPRMGGVFLRPAARRLFPIVLVLLSGAACLWLAWYLTRPIRAFRAAGQRIAGGDLTARVGPDIGSRRDEFGALARDFDRMAARVEELLNSQQRLVRDVSHELRSPLARLQAAVGLIRQKNGDVNDPNLDRVEREADNLNVLIGEVLQYSRLQGQATIRRERCDLTELVGNVVDDASFEGQAAGREVVFEAGDSRSVQSGDAIMADIDVGLVHSAIENVVRNALRHSTAVTTVTLESLPGPVPSARISVVDDGPGVAPGDVERIFEPFFTTIPNAARATTVSAGSSAARGAGPGIGIGLAIAGRAIELHGGTISAANGTGGGLVVEISLPLESVEPAPDPA